jgi:hypothetical protein
MTDILADTALTAGSRAHHGSTSAAIQALLRSRREVRAIVRRAARLRLALGYAHIPKRVWNRRSALIVEGGSLSRR